MKRSIWLFGVLVLLALSAGCAGTVAQQRTMPNGMTVTTGSKTDIAGNNNSWVHLQQPGNPNEPATLELKKEFSSSTTSWTGCADEKPNKSAKNIKREVHKETLLEEVINPRAQGGKASFGFGDNPGPAEMIVPSLVNAGSRLGAAGIRAGYDHGINISNSPKGGAADVDVSVKK